MTISDRIRNLCKQNGISVTKLEKDLGYGNGSLTKSTTSSIKADRLHAVAEYFGVPMEYLYSGPLEMTKPMPGFAEKIKEEVDSGKYYIDDATREIAEFLFDNPAYKVLFDASRKTKPEDIEKVAQMIQLMNGDD